MANVRHSTAPKRTTPSRRVTVALRWTLVALWACIVVVAPLSSASVTAVAAQAAVFAVFGFLLVNALWQHMSLKSACAMAVVAACLAISASEVLHTFVLEQGVPDSLVFGLCGAVVGTLLARPLLKRIDRIAGSV